MKRYWFKAKKYGWGWQPATWEGWLVLIVFLIIFVLNTFRLGVELETSPDTVRTISLQNIGLILLLIIVCYRTGERPRWQWGGKKKQWKTANDELNREL